MERSGLYGFLAAAFRSEPDVAALRELSAPAFEGVFDVTAGDGREVEAVEELAVEFSALFLGPGGHISPYESVYAEGGGQLLGTACVAVKTYIEACGFEYATDGQVLPDHISVELDFMSEVARQESVAWQDGQMDTVRNCLEYEQEFLTDHLGRWAPDFCLAILARAKLPFYRQLATITNDFLRAEKDEINNRLSSLDAARRENPPVKKQSAAVAAGSPQDCTHILRQ
jgi:TorA maturation chaperone TorD